MTTIGGDGAHDSVGLQHRSLREVVLDELRRSIIDGRYVQGERLFEEEIAHRLDVSRNPVREALQALALDGFVELEPRRGARVATVSSKRAEELFEIRESLEGLVARLAARHRTDAQLAGLRELVDTGEAAAAGGELEVLPELNTRFHRALALASHNQLLATETARLSHLIAWVYVRRVNQRSARSWSEHHDIVDAIAAQDELRALRIAELHIANARAAFFSDTATGLHVAG
ncbi:MAG: GntR family transcriptional regulator [Acidimicrobiia bacterium]